jgi:hypothetical protein
MQKVLRRFLLGAGSVAILLIPLTAQTLATTSDSTVYGGGKYGACSYGSCSITLTSGGLTTLNVIPTASGQCTVQSDVTSVLTDNGSGYNLSVTTGTTNNSLVGGSTSINASSGSVVSPIPLVMNTWGFRVDNLGGFGFGPTSAQSNSSVPGVTFAGVPASNQTPAVLASSTGPANPAVGTTVWYGICANATVPSDTYTTTILYTAVTN